MSNKIIFCGVGQGIPHHTGELENFAQLLSKVKMMDETEWFFLPRLFWSSICPHGRPSDWGWEQRRRKSSCQISARNLGRQTGTKWYQSTRKKYDEALAKKAYTIWVMVLGTLTERYQAEGIYTSQMSPRRCWWGRHYWTPERLSCTWASRGSIS